MCWWHLCKIDDNANNNVYKKLLQEDEDDNKDDNDNKDEKDDKDNKDDKAVDNNIHKDKFVGHVINDKSQVVWPRYYYNNKSQVRYLNSITLLFLTLK